MKFSEITGQETVKQRLINSVKVERVSHAQLFAGPEGNGALALAVAYAQYLCCENKSDTDSCGMCNSCIKFQKLAHPDLHFSFPIYTSKDKDKKKSSCNDFSDEWRSAFSENHYLTVNDWYESIDLENKQGYMPVEESTDITRKLSLKPYESEYKILIMWLPEKMRIDAANKLLKIIEEPPDKTLFILVTENAEQVISTILSRTQLIKVSKMKDDDLLNYLTTNFPLDKKAASKIVHVCEGNMRLARELAANQSAEENNEETFLAWMRLCYKAQENFDQLLKWIEPMAKAGREKQKNFISFAMEVIRECTLMNYGESSMVRFGNDLEKMRNFSRFVNTGNADAYMETFNKAYHAIERNAHTKILFINLSLRMRRIMMMKEVESEKLEV